VIVGHRRQGRTPIVQGSTEPLRSFDGLEDARGLVETGEGVGRVRVDVGERLGRLALPCRERRDCILGGGRGARHSVRKIADSHDRVLDELELRGLLLSQRLRAVEPAGRAA
jgi:hypothetical protein